MDNDDISEDLENLLSSKEALAEIERLKAENAALKAKTRTGLSLKVSQKGGVSVYGLGRYPVTLYKQQWLKLLEFAEEIRGFIDDHDSELASKD